MEDGKDTFLGANKLAYSSENYLGLNSIKNSINQELLCVCAHANTVRGRLPDEENIAYAF